MIAEYFDFRDTDVQDALRLALQSAVAGAAMFALMKAFAMPERFVGVLSAVMVIQPSAGAALSEGKNRFLATIVGALIGLACLIALPGGYGTVAALAISMFVMNYIAGFRADWRYGVVAAVALALGSESDATQTAIDRSIAIGVGVALGSVVALVVWPEFAEKRTRRYLTRALNACADYLSGSVKGAAGQNVDLDRTARSYRDSIEAADGACEAISFNDADGYRARVRAVKNLWIATAFIQRVAEDSDPAREGELKDHVASLRAQTCDIARDLAGDERVSGDRFDDARSQLEKARAYVGTAAAGSDALDESAQGALVFGLGEIIDSLEDYSDAAGK